MLADVAVSEKKVGSVQSPESGPGLGGGGGMTGGDCGLLGMQSSGTMAL